MATDILHVLAVIVGAFPQIVLSAIFLACIGVLVAAAFAEAVIRYGETGPGSYSKWDRMDGLDR